jgi:O-antigen/teichoic acid export membrane protein
MLLCAVGWFTLAGARRIWTAHLEGLSRFGPVAGLGVLLPALNLLFAVAAWTWHWSLGRLIAAFTVGFAVDCAVTALVALRGPPPGRPADTPPPSLLPARELITFGVFAWLPTVGTTLTLPLITAVLRHAADPASVADIGYVAVAFSLVSLNYLVLNPVARAAFPAMAEIHSGPATTALDPVIAGGLRLATSVALVILLGFAVAGPPLVTLLFGPAYGSGTAPFFLILAAAAFADAPRTVADPLFAAAGQVRTLAAVELGRFVLLAGLATVAAPRAGATGVAVAVLVTTTAASVIKLGLMRRRFRVAVLAPGVDLACGLTAALAPLHTPGLARPALAALAVLTAWRLTGLVRHVHTETASPAG